MATVAMMRMIAATLPLLFPVGLARAEDADIATLKASLSREIQTCWLAPTPKAGQKPSVIALSVRLNRDGSLAAPPVAVDPQPDEYSAQLVQSAVRAVQRCAPFQSLSAQKVPYSAWRELTLRFDPPYPGVE